MRKILILILVIWALSVPVSALEIVAPSVPAASADVMPEDPETFAEGLWQLISAVILKIRPEIGEAAGVCLSVVAAGLMISLLQPMVGRGKQVAELICALSVAALLLQPARTFINMGANTIKEMTAYGKLLLPVMTAGLAAQGGITKSAALYAGSAVFITILGNLVAGLLIPVVYIFLALSIGNSAVGEASLKKFRDMVKWGATWVLKIGLYVFTGYMSLTGVIAGTADAAALKVTKSTISVAVPVIGNILSNASETVLVSAALVKNAAGVYGVLAILALCLEPFVRIGVQFVFLRLTAAVCGIFATKQTTELIEDFSSAMALLLAATGTICLMLLFSTVCFMKGVG